jgi:hypothetical protein
VLDIWKEEKERTNIGFDSIIKPSSGCAFEFCSVGDIFNDRRDKERPSNKSYHIAQVGLPVESTKEL